MKRVFKTLMVAGGVIFFWRGAWGLMDLYLYPHDLKASYLISVVIGLVILYLFNSLFDELI